MSGNRKNLVTVSKGATHWQIGGGGHAGRTPPPMGPNSFVSANIFTKNTHVGGPRPILTGACPPMGNPGSATATPYIGVATIYGGITFVLTIACIMITCIF